MDKNPKAQNPNRVASLLDSHIASRMLQQPYTGRASSPSDTSFSSPHWIENLHPVRVLDESQRNIK